jgi:hypothetical protein
MPAQQNYSRALKTLAAACFFFVTAPAASGATISVPAGGDLHSALTNAQPGDVIALDPGATYLGNFTLPNKDGAEFITIRTARVDSVPAGHRVTPEQAASFAKLRSPNNQPAIQTAPGAHHWRLVLLELQGTADGDGEIIALGSGSSAQSSLSQVPHDLVVDRCYIHGDPVNGQKRGIALNSAATTVTGSYISDCKRIGQDAQAIAGWNGPGPFTISNNYLEGAAENILFGGADPAIPELVPSDIRITGNIISKPLSWRSEKWQVKNLVELKNARRVTVDRNVIQYTWLAAQVGTAILFTVRNQDGGCPWCQVEQVVFERNIVQHSAAAVSILGVDNIHPSRQTRSIAIRNNVFADIDDSNWGANGYCFLLTGGPRDIVIDHNTMVQEHSHGILQVEGPPVLGFSFTNNIARHNAYGIKGSGRASGSDTISAFFPASQVNHNVIADGDSDRYPRDNLFPSSSELRAQFLSYQSGNYQLIATSPWRAAASDGRAIGADLDALAAPPLDPPEPRRPQEEPR